MSVSSAQTNVTPNKLSIHKYFACKLQACMQIACMPPPTIMKFLVFAIILVGLLGILASCGYTAPYRPTALAKDGSLAADHPVIVTISGVEHRTGQRRAFFHDTRAVLAELPDQPGLLGYSFKFEIIGSKAWTITAWRDEASRDAFVGSPAHRVAVRNSGETSQNVRFVTVTRPLSSLPIGWKEALALINEAPVRTRH